ncbi:transcriptional elongation regulator MINIYO isoform X2 [Zea mays]|uniref:Transcriptional elongation regulator MINIYO n=1 Tax=Zea mays TaxID=4577 RepID=A0A1D6P293_MAIZE|nr:transcriptional elongation regulator MINIYO isoform X2 [Zea mays]AQL04127.1 Transcriptional elongation regulator MINIYO [Zea mays]|eukprot:XP_008659704.1 transcriptional elongation regulator MINIYO isoform X2 [Zea mays]
MDATTKRRHQPGGAQPTRRKVVEEPFHTAPPTPAAASPSRLVGAIVEKGYSAAAPSSAPRPSVLPFPVARHRSHGPHWVPLVKDAPKDETADNDDEMDMDETDYHPVAAAAAGPVRRKEKKGMDFSRWREFVGDAPPKRRQGKPVQAKKQSDQRIDAGAVASKVGGVAAEGRGLEGGAMRLDSGNASEGPGPVLLVSDVVSKKPMSQVESRDELVNTSEARNLASQAESMDLDGRESSMEAEISAENMARLAGMSAGEIAEAQADIVNKLNPALLEMLRRRGREKSGGTKDVGKDKGLKNSGLQKNKRATPGDWLTAGEHTGHSWKVWSERVERIRSCRFTLDGDILGFQSSHEQQDGKKMPSESVAERDFLRTEGDPAAVGYTINEAVALTRSMVPGQRVLALQLLASILNRALQSLHKTDLMDNVKGMNSKDNIDDWQAVWSYALGPEPELVLSLRMALDDNHDSVVLSCTKVVNVMLSCEFNESYFEFSEKVGNGKDICTAPVFRSKPDLDGGFLEGGFWKYNTKPSNILPHCGDNDEDEADEKHTIQDDVVVSGQDVAAGFVRMGILPRICFLLEMDPSPALEDYLVSVLVALARHSPQSADAILNCPRLIQSVTKLLINQGSMEIRSSQIRGVTLLKVLSKYNRQTCLNFVNHGVFQQALWHWYRKAGTIEDWVRSGKEKCKLSSAMMVEQLRFWRTCISYGFCMLNSILERISPDVTPEDKSYSLPWIPDFVPKIGLGIISNGFFSCSTTVAGRNAEHQPFCCASLVQGLCYMRCHGNVDVSLSSISCLQRLVQLSWSVDRVIQGATKCCSECFNESGTGEAGKLLAEGISSLWHNDLLHLLTSLLPMISSQWSISQNIEMFGRGGPAPGVGFGWGTCGGGFWSLKCLLAQLDSQLVVELIKCFSSVQGSPIILDEGVKLDNVTNTVVTASNWISSTLGLSLIAGPGQIYMLEKVFDMIFEPSILKYLKSSIHKFTSDMELLKPFEWDLNEDEYMLFSSVLKSHFRSRWLAIKKKHSDKYAGDNSSTKISKTPEILETIQEETELSEAVNQPCNTLMVEWAHQRLPLPIHWILSAVCCIDDPKGTLSTSANYILDVSRAGLIFLLGLEAISATPCLHAPLIWKIHALSVSIRSSMHLLQEDRSRDIFCALQELYGLHLNRLYQKFCKPNSIEEVKGVVVGTSEEAMEISSLEILRFQEKIHGSYTTFVESLVDQFAAVSYGDFVFGRQVAIYLHRKAEPAVRLAAWNALSSAYVLELLPPLDNCIGNAPGYLEPLEDDEKILESYAKSWTSGVLDKALQRDSMAFTLAKHHLSGFVFQSSDSGTMLRKKLVKSLIRCYAQKRHHEVMLKCFVQQGIAQDSKSSELDRRFEILKDACEMNSNLVGEVQRLKACLGQ